jgi:transposase
MDQGVTAMRAYSMDLRERVAATVDEGRRSQSEIARLFRVTLSSVSRLLKRRREAGTLAPRPHRGGPRPALDFAQRWRLRRMAQQHNDDTLDELRRRGGFRCSLTTIWRALRRGACPPRRSRCTPTSATARMSSGSGDRSAGGCGGSRPGG